MDGHLCGGAWSGRPDTHWLSAHVCVCVCVPHAVRTEPPTHDGILPRPCFHPATHRPHTEHCEAGGVRIMLGTYGQLARSVWQAHWCDGEQGMGPPYLPATVWDRQTHSQCARPSLPF